MPELGNSAIRHRQWERGQMQQGVADPIECVSG